MQLKVTPCFFFLGKAYAYLKGTFFFGLVAEFVTAYARLMHSLQNYLAFDNKTCYID